ncbi:hypothetical protein ACFPYJ_15690 [Paenibacillus solisilvae]|uniref:Uncharacterized protein n=1 Tax=Paenibacillus solisilvae TaxID=2486751 RepID=A0ABW0W0P6_9BACL
MKMARLGVLLDQKTADNRWKYGINVFENYYKEILAHAGIPFQSLDHVNQLEESSLDILIVALEADDEQTASSIWKFAESGGVVVSYGGLSRMAKKLGCTLRQTAAAGYADVSDMSKISEKLRYLKVTPWKVSEVDTSKSVQASGALHHNQPTGNVLGPVKLSFPIGKGSIERFAVHLIESIAGFQQGTQPVLKDGISAPDGTGDIIDDVLKADDGFEMDWEWDRGATDKGTPYFSTPYADLWREVCISHLLKVTVARGLTLPFLGYWPEGISQVAMISHDSDLNEDTNAETTLDVLEQAQVKTTWCMIEPGYSPYIYERVKRDGHELAFHYNAMSNDNGQWGEEEFLRQKQWFHDATGIEVVSSNKNHITRYEGWGELYEWCETHGVLSDQTRGPSKKGNVGFIFGTCQPYFPIAWWNQQNRIYDLLEIGFLTQDMDMGKWADSDVIDPFLTQVKRVQGVAHFLFHQYHLHYKEEVRAAFFTCVNKAKENGFTFWTGKQINDWVRARRKVTIKEVTAGGQIVIDNKGDAASLVVWVPVADDQANDSTERWEEKFGVKCVKKVL